MANRGYICSACGYVRRALCPVEFGPESAEWPRHCEVPMRLMGIGKPKRRRY